MSALVENLHRSLSIDVSILYVGTCPKPNPEPRVTWMFVSFKACGIALICLLAFHSSDTVLLVSLSELVL